MRFKKKLRLTAELEEAYYSGIAQIKLACIVSDTVFHIFQVEDPYKPVLTAILWCFWEF